MIDGIVERLVAELGGRQGHCYRRAGAVGRGGSRYLKEADENLTLQGLGRLAASTESTIALWTALSGRNNGCVADFRRHDRHSRQPGSPMSIGGSMSFARI
jgi:hypothetical protein